MTLLAPLLESFFTQRLQNQKQVSPNTIASYRDAFRLLLRFAQTHLGKVLSELLPRQNLYRLLYPNSFR